MSIHSDEFKSASIPDLFDHHADTSVTYAPISGAASTTVSFMPTSSDPIFEEFDESGDVVKKEINGLMTNDSARTDHPGIASPARGDSMTINGSTYYVVSFTAEPVSGMWRIMLRNVDVVRRGKSNTRFRN
jgi:hypothetical protein